MSSSPTPSNPKLNRLQRFGLYFYAHFKTTLLLWIALVAFGAACYAFILPREGFPAVNPPFSVVAGTYFVNDAQKVDTEVAKPLSDLIAKQESVRTISTSAAGNFYSVQIEYKDGTDPNAANTKVKDAVAAANILPANATAEYKPVTFGITEDGDNILIAFYGTRGQDTDTINQKAQEAVAFLKGDDGIDGARDIKQVELFKTGINPATKQPVREQVAYDRTGVRGQDGSLVFYDSAIIAAKTQDGVDDLQIYDATEIALDKLNNNRAFDGYKATISAGYAESIREQTGSLQENLLGGLLAVLAVSFLLIGLRASLVTTLSMVSVLAITLGILFAIGYSLNTITLFSLILCLGLIVDDTTIMVEAIDAGRRKKADKSAVIAKAIKKVALASTAGTLTTILGFAPLLFIGGVLGDFIRAIPITIAISLTLSLLVSLSVVPFLGRILLRPHSWTSWAPFQSLEGAIGRTLGRSIRIGLHSRRKLAVIGIAAMTFSIGLTIVGIMLFPKVAFNIFPAPKDSDEMMATLRFVPGTSLTEAQNLTDEVSARLTTEVGSYISHASLYGSGTERQATLNMRLESYKTRNTKTPVLITQLEKAFVDYKRAEVSFAQVGVGPPEGSFGVRIYGDDRTKTLAAAQDIQKFLTALELTRPDGTKAKTESAQVVMPTSITRADGRQYVAVESGFDASDTSLLVTLAQTKTEEVFDASRIRQYGLAEDALQFDFGAESDNQESFKAMLVAFPLLIAAMYVLLALQFKSLAQPLLIFTALPFSIFGIITGLYYTDNPFSFFTMVGVFALIGISVNNTILLTDFANQMRRDGLGRIESIARATQERFRPLLTTSLTAVVALIPLALSDPFWESLAVTLIFGLLSSTLLVVIAFPYYFLGFEYLRAKFGRIATLRWLAGLVIGCVVTGGLHMAIVPLFVALYVMASVVFVRLMNRLAM